MTASRPPRLAFLIVEDQYESREALKNLLTHGYKDYYDEDLRVDAVATVAAAEARIRAARQEGTRYKIAILDLVLPPEDDKQPSAQPELVTKVLPVTDPSGVIFHITAYPTDPKFYECFHNRSSRLCEARNAAASVAFPKAGKGRDWTQPLLDEIAAVVHGDRIRNRFLRLFGPLPDDSEHTDGDRVSPTPVDCDPSRELFALARDVEQHYNLLHPDLRQQLERLFTITPISKDEETEKDKNQAPEVEKDKRTVRVSLF
jgi:hypothetical protein